MAGWKRLVLMGVMVSLPVPVFAASGLAVPLPSIVYRVAVGVAERTQAVAVGVPGFEAVVAKTSDVARRGTIHLSAAELATGRPHAGMPPSARAGRHTREPRARKALAVDRRLTRKAGVGTARAAPRAIENIGRTEPVHAAAAAPAPAEEAVTPRESPPSRETSKPSEPVSTPERPEERGGSPPAPPRSEPKPNPPKEEPKSGPNPGPPPPPPVLRPPPLPPVAVTPPIALPPEPLPPASPPEPVPPLTPRAQLDAIADDLHQIVVDSPGTRRASRVEQVLDKVKSARANLGETPPDNDGALNDIRNADQKLDAALVEGVITVLEHTDFSTRLDAVSLLLKAGP